MKTSIECLILVLGCAVVISLADAAHDGIPEPGLVLYGTVTNTVDPLLLTTGAVQWTVTGLGSSASVVSTIVNVNGQFFYVAHIPFETRAAGGLTFTPTPNTLPLTTQPTPFTRTVSVNGAAAILAPSAYTNFTFSKLDRGRIERVDLLVSLPGGPDGDRDGDGVPDWAEAIAGTDPDAPSSVLKVFSDLRPAPGGGLVIQWSSVAGKSYAVSRATDLERGFVVIAPSVAAAGEVTAYADSSALGVGPFFYRIQVRP